MMLLISSLLCPLGRLLAQSSSHFFAHSPHITLFFLVLSIFGASHFHFPFSTTSVETRAPPYVPGTCTCCVRLLDSTDSIGSRWSCITGQMRKQMPFLWEAFAQLRSGEMHMQTCTSVTVTARAVSMTPLPWTLADHWNFLGSPRSTCGSHHFQVPISPASRGLWDVEELPNIQGLIIFLSAQAKCPSRHAAVRPLRLLDVLSRVSWGENLPFWKSAMYQRTMRLCVCDTGGQMGEPDPEPETCCVAEVQVLFWLWARRQPPEHCHPGGSPLRHCRRHRPADGDLCEEHGAVSEVCQDQVSCGMLLAKCVQS